jgi:hypothetical protein
MTTFFEERTVPRAVGVGACRAAAVVSRVPCLNARLVAAGLALAIWFTSGALPQNLCAWRVLVACAARADGQPTDALSLTQSAVAMLAISAVCTL